MKNLDYHLNRFLVENIESKKLCVGKHNDVPDDQFCPKQLAMGIEIEHEHTNNPELAKAIAKDHLSEIPDYYTRLVQMEKEAGIKD